MSTENKSGPDDDPFKILPEGILPEGVEARPYFPTKAAQRQFSEDFARDVGPEQDNHRRARLESERESMFRWVD